MAIRTETGAALDCYHRSMPGEPSFTLLARDPAAPYAILEWIAERRLDIAARKGSVSQQWMAAEEASLAEAEQCVDDMRAWRRAHEGEWRRPVIVWGPAGSGKTRNAAQLAEYYGKSVIIDEADELLSDNYGGNVLMLSQTERPDAIHISDALRAAGIAQG